ncbi:erythromycin esterase family protein [Nonomuraea sp. PA05]|uniref:erythromycin esterase family protein n=1 Tax=Nonomuraea sp. PA05 TaxID=2604466 RepID=UPI0011DAAEA1|nr:erythromycin esterase family protein [Nonomuraea sp. PA05]TYB68763.1 erythromycin esterase family protein [Nonomuraea sp. PA05]
MHAAPSVADAARDLDVEGVAAVTRFVRSLPARPRLLGLGEAMHDERPVHELRNEIFRELVEREGFRAFAIESDCVAGLLVDEYVRTGEGSLDEVMRAGFSHGFWDREATRDLLRWMRAYNEGRPGGERLRFFGFDAPLEMMSAASPRHTLVGLYDYLSAAGVPLPCSRDTLERLLGPDERWTDQAAAMDPSRSVGNSPDVAELRLLADDLVPLLTTHAPHLIPATSGTDRERAEWERAHLYARTATGLLRYHAGMADPSPQRVARLLGLRDAMMADNLEAVARHGPALVFAHNRHLQREISRWRLADLDLEWWSAGAIIAARLGTGYAFLASGLGAVRHQGLGDPDPGTVEGVLAALPGQRYLVDSRMLASALEGAKLTQRTDTADNYGYFPLDPDQLGATDGIIFVKDVAGGP